LNAPSSTDVYPLSLHDALPISVDPFFVGGAQRGPRETNHHAEATHARKDSLFCAIMAPRAADDAVRLCQSLIRLDTTNPPGREQPAAELLAGWLAASGLEPQVLAGAPGRANVVARLGGSGELPPLLLTAHLDVVEADPAAWSRPPFSGDIADGFLWGRGAVDMKSMAAMSPSVVGALAWAGARPRRDIIFAGVADEEAGSDEGASWLVAHHPDLVRAEFALGEVGGFTMYLGGLTLYPVQVA